MALAGERMRRKRGNRRLTAGTVLLACTLWLAVAPRGVLAEEPIFSRRLPAVVSAPQEPAPLIVTAVTPSLVEPALLEARRSDQRDTYALERLPPLSRMLHSAEPLTTLVRVGERELVQLIGMQEPVAPQPPPPLPPGETLPQPNPPAELPKSDPAAEKSDAEAAEDGETPTLGRQPVNNSLQFLRAESVLLKPGAWQVDTGFAYTLFENDFPLAILGGNDEVIGVTEGNARQRLFYTPLAARYGWSRNVQLFGVMPIGWSRTQISTVGSSDSEGVGGLGDLTTGMNLHLLEGEDEFPDVIGTVSVTAPTGQFNTPVFGLVPGSNLGQGFWAVGAQLLCIHRYDPIIVFYGAGYRHLFERSFDGVLFTPGEQVDYQFGVGFAVNDRVTLSTALQGFAISAIQFDHDTIEGTNLEPISLRCAATIARNCRILEPFVTFGLTPSAPAAFFGVVVTFY